MNRSSKNLVLAIAWLATSFPPAVMAQDATNGSPSFWQDRGGYADTKITPTWWQIDTNGGGKKKTSAVPLAMYRLLLFAKYYKYKYVNIVDARRVIAYGAEEFWAKGVGSNFQNAPFDCEAGGRFKSYCRQISVDQGLQELQLLLGANDADSASEIERISSKYANKP